MTKQLLTDLGIEIPGTYTIYLDETDTIQAIDVSDDQDAIDQILPLINEWAEKLNIHEETSFDRLVKVFEALKNNETFLTAEHFERVIARYETELNLSGDFEGDLLERLAYVYEMGKRVPNEINQLVARHERELMMPDTEETLHDRIEGLLDLLREQAKPKWNIQESGVYKIDVNENGAITQRLFGLAQYETLLKRLDHQGSTLWDKIQGLIVEKRNATRKHQNTLESVRIYLKALALYAHSIGNAGTHKEKDERLRGMLSVLESGVQALNDDYGNLLEKHYWEFPDLFRSDYPVRRYMERIRELERQLAEKSGESTSSDPFEDDNPF